MMPPFKSGSSMYQCHESSFIFELACINSPFLLVISIRSCAHHLDLSAISYQRARYERLY